MNSRIFIGSLLIVVLAALFSLMTRTQSLDSQNLGERIFLEVAKGGDSETLKLDTSVELIDQMLMRLEQGDMYAALQIAYRPNIYTSRDPLVQEKLLALNQPAIHAQYSFNLLSGANGSPLNWDEALIQYLLGLNGCQTRLYRHWVTPVDLIMLAGLSQSEQAEIHAQLQFCANYNFANAVDLAVFEWKLLGDSSKFLTYVDYFEAAMTRQVDNLREELGEEVFKETEELAGVIRPNPSARLYWFNAIDNAQLENLHSIRTGSHPDTTAYRYWLGQEFWPALASVPEGDFSKLDEARRALAAIADESGLAATTLHIYNQPQYGIELTDLDYALSSQRAVRSDDDSAACQDEIDLSALYPDKTAEELEHALELLCIRGQANQLKMLKQKIAGDYPKTEQDRTFAFEGLTTDTIPTISGISPASATGLAALTVGLIFLYLAFLSYTANSLDARNRAIAGLLLSEGLFLTLGIGIVGIPTGLAFVPLATAVALLMPVAFIGLILSQGYFISTTSTAIGRIFNKYRIGVILAALYTAGLIYSFIIRENFEPFPIKATINFNDAFIWKLDENFALFGILGLISMHLCVFLSILFEYRSSDRNDSRGTQYFLFAYYARLLTISLSVLMFASIAALALSYEDENPPQWFYELGGSNLLDYFFSNYVFGELIYGLFFCYGVVKGNIFGITQLVKRSAVKVLFTGALFTAFYFMETIVSQEFSDSLGNIAGFFGASLVLLFEKPINKHAYNLIDFLLPDAETLSEAEQSYFYLHKLALEDGVVTQDEQRMLDFTARNLGLSTEDILRISNRIDNSSVKDEKPFKEKRPSLRGDTAEAKEIANDTYRKAGASKEELEQRMSVLLPTKSPDKED